MSPLWDARFLALASHVAQWSKDPSTKCGAVVVDGERRIVGIGYNGFPRGVADDDALLADRAEKYPRIVHAEANAILNAVDRVKGCSLYTWPLPPCSECAKLIIQSGIVRVAAPMPGEEHAARLKINIAMEMFGQAGVQIHLVPKKAPWSLPASCRQV